MHCKCNKEAHCLLIQLKLLILLNLKTFEEYV